MEGAGWWGVQVVRVVQRVEWLVGLDRAQGQCCVVVGDSFRRACSGVDVARAKRKRGHYRWRTYLRAKGDAFYVFYVFGLFGLTLACGG